MEKVVLPPNRIDELLGELCVKLGFCLHPAAHVRIVNSPPRNIDRFTDVVMRADGVEPCHGEVRRSVRAIVERFFDVERDAANSIYPPPHLEKIP